ncbi:MAG: HD domain-containing protein [Saprospiraceae bacterium]
MKELIDKTIDYVKQRLEHSEHGHDWWHISRVYHNALNILSHEPGDVLIVSLAALLHDIADAKFHDGDETIGPGLAKEFLEQHEVPTLVTDHVISIIENMSFKSSLGTLTFTSIEMNIVQDADRLDAIGAIGIARAFHYGGYKNRVIYDPEILPNLNMTKEQYKKNDGPTINHFFEKLLLLKDKMKTATGKKLAEHRHEFMKKYLQEFYSEVETNEKL